MGEDRVMPTVAAMAARAPLRWVGMMTIAS